MPRDYASPLIVWTWQDPQVEQPALRERAVDEIARRGFSGILAMLRGCRYPVSDPEVINAARHAADVTRGRGLAFWFALDPRLDQGRLIAMSGGAATYLLPGREGSGPLPCEAAVDGEGRYWVRVPYGEPRGQHMLSEVAITFEPGAVERAFAYRKDANGRVVRQTMRDVTNSARLFLQRKAGYLEVFGRVDAAGEGWHVLALPRARSTYPELGSPTVRAATRSLYRAYQRAGVTLDGVFWDEIGYVSGYGADRGRLPYGPAVREGFARRHGADLADRLVYLLLEDDAGEAARVRRDYYAAVQDAVQGAQEACYAEARRLWGAEVESGIHQTWHQDADDLPHGSADWWRGSRALSGGFADCGPADAWHEAERSAEMLSMMTLAVSLARFHPRPMPFFNLWGVEYGEPTSHQPAHLLDWWGHLLASFGIVWLAHTYGPNSYVDAVTNWGPGYPDHPTWRRFDALNERLARIRALTDSGLPEADVAVVYPLPMLAGIGSADASPVAREVQAIVARLRRRHVAVDLISPDLLGRGEPRAGALHVPTPRGWQAYRAVVYPHAGAPEPPDAARLKALEAAQIPVHRPSVPRVAGGPDASGARDDLDALPVLARGPEGALVGVFRCADGDVTLLVVPAGVGARIEGEVAYGDCAATLLDLRGVAALRFGPDDRLRDALLHEGRLKARRH